ncbi:MAG TPA: hypothetical protein VIN10_05100, partial [Bacteroidales bacterium]
MKKNILLFTIIFISAIIFAQSPQKMSYQAVVRGESNDLVTNQAVGMKISILQGSADGNSVYSEILAPLTNSNGLLTIEFGGEPGFESIDWSEGPYFIKTETDPTGGTDYTISGTCQLLSVPYALYAETSGDSAIWKTNSSDIFFNSGDVGVGTSFPESKFELYDLNKVAELTIHGHGSSFATSSLVFKVTTAQGNARGSGVFLLDSAGQNEWFAGRPYGNYSGSTTDKFVIQRKPNDSTHQLSTAGLFYGSGEPTGSERLFTVESNGFVGIGTHETPPASRLEVAHGDV